MQLRRATRSTRTAHAASDVQLNTASRPAAAGKNSACTHRTRSMPSVTHSERATRSAPNSVLQASWSMPSTDALRSPSAYWSSVPGYWNRAVLDSAAPFHGCAAGVSDSVPQPDRTDPAERVAAQFERREWQRVVAAQRLPRRFLQRPQVGEAVAARELLLRDAQVVARVSRLHLVGKLEVDSQAPRVGRGRSGSAARAMGDRQREGGAAPRAVVATQDELRRTTAHRHELDAGGIVEPECSRHRAFRRDPAGAPVGAPLGPWQGGACLPL